jgi:uncharacterized membrane protein YdjX (TVP38/TMEM64 family)
MEKQKRKSVLNIVLLSAFTILLIYITIKYAPIITQLISNPEKFRVFLLSYGDTSIFVFMLFHVLQVVIAVIPGELIQIAGGYIYGTFFGTLYSSLGILLGSIIVLNITHILGCSVIKLFVSKENFDKFDFLINNKKAEITMFILFLIPGLPKDILTYIAGLTPLKPRRFFMLTTIARLPGILISSYVGTNIQTKQYNAAIFASIIAVTLFIAGFLIRDKVISQIKQSNIEQ